MKSLLGLGKLALTRNINQQSCFPFNGQCPWAWAKDFQVAKDKKERVSAISLVSTVFLWHCESSGYMLRTKYHFCSLYPTFRIYQCSTHSLISESSQNQNIQILSCRMQLDLSIAPVTFAAHSVSLKFSAGVKFCWRQSMDSYASAVLPPSFPPVLFKLLQLLRSFYSLHSSTRFLSQLACPVSCLSTSVCPSLSNALFLWDTPFSSTPTLSSLCWWFLNLLFPKPIHLGSGSHLWYCLTDILPFTCTSWQEQTWFPPCALFILPACLLCRISRVWAFFILPDCPVFSFMPTSYETTL